MSLAALNALRAAERASDPRLWLLGARGLWPKFQQMATLGDREWLVTALLPRLAARPDETIVFAGCDFYTWHYEYLVQPGPARAFITVDCDPEKSVWGAARHFVCGIEAVEAQLKPAIAGVLVMNGLLGFGTDTAAQRAEVFGCARRLVAPGGLAVLGWNHDRVADPLAEFLATTGFVHAGLDGLPPRTVFGPPTHHVFDLFVNEAKS